MEVRIEESWKKALAAEWEKPYFAALASFVRNRYASGPVFPPAGSIFAAFDACPFEDVKVVILGQDPYHGVGQANGLCFSVADGIEFPPSLANIFKEMLDDVGAPGQTMPARRLVVFGASGRAVAQRYAYCRCAQSRFASGSRLGNIYRRGDCAT